MRSIMAVMCLFMLYLASCSDNSGVVSQGDIDKLIATLQQEGFIIQEGNYIQVDAIDLLNKGIILNANGNNAGNPYLSYALPMGPGQTYPNEFLAPGYTDKYLSYRLRPDEALLLIGYTPPEVTYFSYRSFLTSRYYSDNDRRENIYGALGDTVNILTAKVGSEDCFNQPFVLITSADKGINQKVLNSLLASGYPESIINNDIIPGQMLNMGLDAKSDTFTFLARTALPKDKSSLEAYLANPKARLFRLTPKEPLRNLNLYPRPELKPRGTGRTEAWLQPAVDSLRTAIMNKYSAYEALELPSSQWIPETLVGIDQRIDVLGESRDTPYLWTGSAPLPSKPSLFTIPDSKDEFIIVYGVNHHASGKATYSNFTVYGARYLNGVVSVASMSYDGSPTFVNSADAFIKGHPQARYLYAWKVTRRCNGEPYCLEVPYGPQHYGFGIAPDDQYAFIGFRAYLEPETKVGAKWEELIYDRAIKFKK